MTVLGDSQRAGDAEVEYRIEHDSMGRSEFPSVPDGEHKLSVPSITSLFRANQWTQRFSSPWR